MIPESQNNEATRDSIARQRLRKCVPAAAETQETTEKLLKCCMIPESQNNEAQETALLGNGSVNAFPQQRKRKKHQRNC
jgi:hypothetical protein